MSEYQALPPTQAPRPKHSFGERIIGTFKLSRPIFDEVRRDPGAMTQAAIVVTLTGLLSGISRFADYRGRTIDTGESTYHVTNSPFAVLASGIGVALASLVFWVLGSLLYRFVAIRILGSPESGIQWQEVARPFGFASVPSLLILLTPIPILGWLVGSVVGIWTVAAQIVALSETFRVSKWRAFAIILVAALVLVIVLSLIFCAVILAAVVIF